MNDDLILVDLDDVEIGNGEKSEGKRIVLFYECVFGCNVWQGNSNESRSICIDGFFKRLFT